jgi:outer membrane receptor protein involved in Fe transport
LFRTKASTQAKLNDRFGFSVAGYYDRSDGYFINNYSGKKADPMESAGGHVRFDYQLSKRWKTSLSAHYNFSEQGAFPYHKYDKTTGVTEPVNYNDEGAYLRRMGLTALNLEYKDDNILFTSATSYQGLNDDMNMDQDYTPAPIYSIRQRQKQNAFTQELAVKSNKESNYRWSFGLFGSYDNFKTNISENWTSDGLQTFLDMILAPIKAGGARLPNITVAGEGTIPNPVSTKAVTSNAAIYHQSTYNNLFIDGLSITGGLRLDYGKTSLDYQSAMEMRLLVDLTSVVPYPVPPVSLQGDTTLQGFLSMNHFMLLPKIALKYEWNRRNYVYASATKGFNPGGYNIQMFAETITQILIGKMANGYMPATNPIDWGKDAAFNPEYNWTYELGYKGEWLNRRLSAEIALFYVDMHDMQLAKTVSFGRELTNAGKAVSKGIDLHVDARICAGLTAAANYGYIHATFKEYDNGKADLKGYYLPFVPRQTFSICAAYEKNFTRSFVKRFDVQVQYNGADKIYWTEANDVTQDFYSLLNLKSGVTKGHFTLNIWAKNLLNTHYHAFYFADVLGNAFLQQGKPALWGVDLVVAF